MDESNDLIVKSALSLFGYYVGDVRTKFLDMLIVNIGTAVNLFNALDLSLNKKGLSFL